MCSVSNKQTITHEFGSVIIYMLYFAIFLYEHCYISPARTLARIRPSQTLNPLAHVFHQAAIYYKDCLKLASMICRIATLGTSIVCSRGKFVIGLLFDF